MAGAGRGGVSSRTFFGRPLKNKLKNENGAKGGQYIVVSVKKTPKKPTPPIEVPLRLVPFEIMMIIYILWLCDENGNRCHANQEDQ